MDAWAAPAGATGLTWAQLRDAWLAAQTPNTRRSYGAALHAFTRHVSGAPDQVRITDVLSWQQALQAAGRCAATVRSRLAALSAWYRFLGQPHGPDGQPAHEVNPVAPVRAPRVEPFGRSRPITSEEFRRLLAVADPRLRAWLMLHVLTLRRRAEVARLTLADFERRGGTWWYSYRGKGRAQTRWREMPAAVVEALEAWLGRHLEDCVGGGLNVGPGLYLPPDGERHTIWRCGESALARALKRAARAAGLDPRRVHIHALRHLGALLRRQDGAPLEEVQEALDHRSVATTMIYLQHLEQTRDSRAESIARRLLGDE